MTISINISGNDVFTKNVDIFQTLIDLKDALNGNDPDQVRTLSDNLDASSDQIIIAQSQVGAQGKQGRRCPLLASG